MSIQYSIHRLAHVGLVLILALAVSAVAQPDHGTTLLGAGFTGKPLVLEGDLVLETIGLYETIRDYTSATEPQIVGWHDHDLIGHWRDLLHDDGLVVALRDLVFPFGFSVTDVSDPTAPQFLGEISGNEYSSGWLRGRAVLLSTLDYVVVYDLADPTSPAFSSLVLTGALPTSRWFSAVGDVLYLVDEGTTLRALDVSNPLLPSDLGTTALAGDRIDAMVAGDGHLYLLLATDDGVGGEDLELVAYDVSTPLAPVETSRLLLASDGLGGLTMIRADQLLLAATGGGQVQAFDLADPAAPAPGWSLAHRSIHFAVSASQVFVQTDERLFIYPRTGAMTPPGVPVDRLILPRLRGIVGEGPIQLTLSYEHRNLIAPLDITNPLLPTVGPWFDMGIEGGFEYADGLGLVYNIFGQGQLVDLSDPTAPALLGAFQEPGAELGRAAMTTEAAVITAFGVGEPNLIFDFSDPMQPYLKSTVGHGDPVRMHERLLLSRDDDRFNLIDLTDLSEPTLLGGLTFDYSIGGIDMDGGYVYVVTESATDVGDLHVVDIQDPTAPVIVNTVPLDTSGGWLAFNGPRLHLTDYGRSLIFDISDPTDPVYDAEFPYPGHTGYGMAFNGNIVTYSGWLITRRDDGFDITDVPDGATLAACRLEPAYPNPFNPSTTIAFSIDHRRDLAVTIHDVRGHKVVDLVHDSFESGPHMVQWHGQDAHGQGVASGVYLVRVHGAGVELSQTVTLVK